MLTVELLAINRIIITIAYLIHLPFDDFDPYMDIGFFKNYFYQRISTTFKLGNLFLSSSFSWEDYYF